MVALVLLTATAALAQSPVCGNGVTEPGEQCDVANTLSGADECDGCHTDCTVTAECGLGPCTDNLDNDGDGLIDEKDPKCSSLQQLSPFALSGSSTRSLSVRAGVGTRVSESALQAGAAICSRIVDMRSLATVAGSVVALDQGKFSHSRSSSIGGKFVTTSGQTPPVPGAPVLVGPDWGACSSSPAACMSPLDCVGRDAECLGRAKLNAVNAFVDLTGAGVGAEELARCDAALAQMAGDTSLLTLTGPPLGKLRVGSGAKALTINLDPGGTVLNYESVILGVRGRLTINAPRSAVLIIRVAKRLAFLAHARVELIGGIEPENILWIVTGGKGAVLINHSSLFQGFLWAPQRSVKVNFKAQVRGSLVGRQVRVGRNATIEHHPFLSLLPSRVEMSVATTPAIAAAPMTYDVVVTNYGPGYAVVANLRFELDPQTAFSAAEPSQGLCRHDGSASGGIVTCYLGDLADPPAAPMNEASVQIQVQVGAAASELDATATLSHTIAPNGTPQIVPVTTVVTP